MKYRSLPQTGRQLEPSILSKKKFTSKQVDLGALFGESRAKDAEFKQAFNFNNYNLIPRSRFFGEKGKERRRRRAGRS